MLGVQAHNIGGGVDAGVHFNVIGGLDLKLRLGLAADIDLIQASTKVPLPSRSGDRDDRRARPQLAGAVPPRRARGRALAFGGVLAPATREQTGGLAEGAQSSTIGAYFGGGFNIGLYKGLGLEAAYTCNQFAVTHFSGQLCRARDETRITIADRGSAEHLITSGSPTTSASSLGALGRPLGQSSTGPPPRALPARAGRFRGPAGAAANTLNGSSACH